MSTSEVRRLVADAPDAHVAHVTLDITLDGERALVSVALDATTARVVCSCGVAGCAHAAHALLFLRQSGAELPMAAARDEAARSSPGTRAAPSVPPPAMPPRHVAADALDDAITAIVREGPKTSPTLDDALARAHAALRPAPLALDRFVGRLRTRLAARDVHGVVALLATASRLADVLREGDELAVARWLGREATPLVPPERLEEVTLVEVAREWLAAPSRAGLERRWLLVADGPRKGTVLREERRRGEPPPSIGPCPRTINVGLAELDPGSAPQRVRLLQYEVDPRVDAARLDVVHAAESARFADLSPDTTDLAEPFALVAAVTLEQQDGVLVARDADGATLPLRGPEPRGPLAPLLLGGGPPRFLAGRLVRLWGAVSLAPASACLGTTITRLA